MSTRTPLHLYRQMALIRQCEERLARSYLRGQIHGACHTYVGQEAIATGVCAHLREDDVVFSTHRGHGHALAKGLDPRQLFAELYGRETGCSRGRGGSHVRHARHALALTAARHAAARPHRGTFHMRLRYGGGRGHGRR